MKESKVYSGLRLMLNPEALIPFILGSIALSVAGNSLTQVLFNWLGSNTKAGLTIFICALLIFIAAAWAFTHYLNSVRHASPLPNKKSPDKRRGLILLVSNEPTVSKAVEWHEGTLQRCWLVCSSQTATLAEKIKTDLVNSGKITEIILINDVYDLVECRNKVENIFSNLPSDFDESDVILDFTGMTVMASVGAVIACLDERRAIQYTPARRDVELQHPIPIDPVEVELDWKRCVCLK